MNKGSKFLDQRGLAFASLAVAAVFFISAIVFASGAFKRLQLDLTKGSLYTLSDGTYEVLTQIKEPITLRLFLSRALVDTAPAFGTYSARVRDLLERYVSLADGKIRLEIIHPEPFSREEDRAVGFELQGVPLNQSGENVYFGLVGTNMTDDIDVIPFLSPQRERFLEYDVTRLVYNLANPKKKVVALVSSIAIEADPALRNKPWRVIEMMRQFFEVRSMGFEPDLKDDVDVLMIVHPIGLSDKSLYAIDQWVLKGGRTIIFVDPYAEEGSRSNAAQRLPPDRGSDLEKLFKAWGVSYTRDKVLGDQIGAQRVSVGEEITGGRPVITDYLAWITLNGERFKRDDVVTGDLQVINIASAGFFGKAEGATIELDPLIFSSPQSAPMDATKVRVRPDPRGLLRDFKPENKPLTVAARVHGQLKTAFADGPPAEKKEGEAKPAETKPEGEAAKPAGPPHIAQSTGPIGLVIVADTDILADQFWTQTQDFFGQRLSVPTANNGDFVINAVDNLAGGAALLKLRGRGVSDRPFHTVQMLQREAEIQYRAKEQELADKLKEVEGKLKDLQTKDKSGGKSQILTDEQKSEVEKFRGEMLQIRTELRDVQRALRSNIESLESWLKVLNIGLMPLIVLFFAVGLALWRGSRARPRRIAQSAI